MSASLEAGDACTFRVQPASEASIETLVLVFTDLYVFSGEMYVYEGAQQQQQNLRWTCLGCGDVLPPPFYFDRGAAFISFRAPQDQVARFAFSYLAHTDDMRVDTGAAYRVDLLMAQALLRAPRTAAGAAPRALAYRDRAETLPSRPGFARSFKKTAPARPTQPKLADNGAHAAAIGSAPAGTTGASRRKTARAGAP